MSKNKQQIKFEADISQFKTATKEAQASIRTLNNELKLNQSQLKGNEENTNILSKRIDLLKEKYNEQKNVVDNTRKSYERAVELLGENSKEAYNLKNQLLLAEKAEQDIKNAIDQTNKQLILQTNKVTITGEAWQKSGEKLKQYGSQIDSIGNKVSVLSTAVAGIAVASVKSAIDFESAFAGVTKTVDGTEEQLEDLRQGILDMSTQVPSSAEEISAVAEAAGQLGIKTEDILSFTKVMIDLGNSTNLSSEEAATSLAKLANIMSTNAEDYDKLGATIVDLGNNFATTEADIVSMAMRIAGTGATIGLSESNVLSLATALSSVGIEAEMGGSAISKAMSDMALAAETGSGKFADLETYAKVAGMSTKEFSKVMKEDAITAITQFITGLGSVEDNGGSLLSLMTELGFEEVRLRDTMLRTANASELFSEAIELGNKAWKDNSALTNEANKRYATTESQMKMLKSEVTKTAIEFGEELAPSLREIVKDIKPMLKSISSAIKAFSELDDEQKQTILTIGAMVVAAGPLVKVFGTITKTAGSTVKAVGTVTKAVGLMKNGIGDATGASADLAKLFKNLATPTGIATTAIVGGMALAVSSINKATEETRKLAEASKQSAEETLKEKQAIDELRNTVDANVQTELNQIDRSQKLWEELQKITDENGKVKEGYEDRAKVITGTLSEALGTEISMTGNVIDKYKELQQEIDKLILKKQGESILSGAEEKYNNAIGERTQKTQELIDKEEELRQAKIKEDELYDEYNLEDGEWQWGWEAQINYKNWDNQVKYVQQLESEVSNLQEIVNDYTNDIADYEYKQELYLKGNVESLQKLVDETGKVYTKNNESIKISYKKQLQEQQLYLKNAKDQHEEAVKNNDEAEKKKTQSVIDESNRRIKTITEELISQTSITEENSFEIKEGWRQLASESTEVYTQIMQTVPDELKEVISGIVNRVEYERPRLVKEINLTNQELLDTISGSEEYKKIAIENLQGYLQGLSDEDLKILLRNAGIKNSEEVIKGIREGNLAETEGMNILESLINGLENNTLTSRLYKTAQNVVSKLTSLFNIKGSVSVNTNNLPGHKTGLAYVPYNNYVARLHEGERVLTKEQNQKYMADNLENKIVGRNIVVQFYPQTMSESELQRAERYIARKWGAAL